MLCSKEFPEKVVMLDHLINHSQFAKLFQPPNINITRQNNKSEEDDVSPGKVLEVSIKAQVNVKQEILQQESFVKKEFFQIGDQSWNSSKSEEKYKPNVDSDVQNTILGKLSILEPVPFEKSKELWNSDGSVEQVLIQMNDQVLNSSKTKESNVQKAIFEQEPIIVPVVFEKSEGLNNKIMDKRPFGCEYCEKRFTQSQAAKKHVRIHTGEKPFGCKICDYKSNDSGNLRKHVKKIHG